MSRPAVTPDGLYYDVSASPRGDLLLHSTETSSWGNATVGVLGIVSFLLNLLAFQRRWRVVVRQLVDVGGAVSPSGVLLEREVPRKLAESTLRELASDIESGRLDPGAT